MNKDKEKAQLRSITAIGIIILTMYFFSPEFKGFLGWENFLVEIYNQCIGLLVPYCIANLLFYKFEKFRTVFTLVLFFVLNCTVEVKTDIPTSWVAYVLLPIAIGLWIVSMLFLNKFLDNMNNSSYGEKGRRRDFIIFLSVLAVNLVIMLYLCNLKYKYFGFE